MLYGDYLTRAARRGGDRIEIVRGRGGRCRRRARSGSPTAARSPPTRSSSPPAISGRRRRAASTPTALGALWVDDPWAEGDLADGLGRGDVVLLLGTGLTAVDAALTLDAAGFRRADRRFVAARPRAARARPARAGRGAAARICRPTASAMLRRVRGARARRSAGAAAVHELRHGRPRRSVARRRTRRAPPLPAPFAALVGRPPPQASRPAVGATIEAMQDEARLAVAAGRLVSAEADGDGALVRFRAARQRPRSRRCGSRGSSIAPAPSSTSPAPASRC